MPLKQEKSKTTWTFCSNKKNELQKQFYINFDKILLSMKSSIFLLLVALCGVTETIYGVPTKAPTYPPTVKPSLAPTFRPTTRTPTPKPTKFPTSQPSGRPSRQPINHPSHKPSRQPSSQPTKQPFNRPTSQPSRYEKNDDYTYNNQLISLNTSFIQSIPIISHLVSYLTPFTHVYPHPF